jgi:hypothetical protein
VLKQCCFWLVLVQVLVREADVYICQTTYYLPIPSKQSSVGFGLGQVSFRIRDPIEMVTLRIRDKDHLKKIILPIFDKYPMFSNKQYDYLRFRDALLSGIIYSADLPEYSRSNEPLNTVDSIINTFYFPAWLVDL